jgi:hypothetical protein
MFSTPAAWEGFFLRSHMTDDTAPLSNNTPDSAAENAPRVRRISNPRPKKVAKEVLAKASDTPKPEQEISAELPSIPFPTTPRPAESPEEESQRVEDWPDSDSDSEPPSALQSQSESSKRKRRRRKGKGQSNAPHNSAAEPAAEDATLPVATESRITDAPQDQRPRPQPGPPSQVQHQNQNRPKIDPELLTKMAWKIYLAEVSEEGVALIGDNDAKDLSRRCFRLAEIFIEEQSRRR